MGIDSATDPLPLPLRRRKYYVYRRGIRIPTISLRTVCTVVSADFQPRCGVKTGTLPRNHLASFTTGGASAVSAKNQWFLDFLSLQELRSLWDVVGIDSATDPLPLPLRRRKYYVYRRGIRIPTTSLRTVCTVVSTGFQPRCGVKIRTLPRNRLAVSATGAFRRFPRNDSAIGEMNFQTVEW